MSYHQKEIIDYLFPNYINSIVERAARHAAEAMREKAAQKADECAEHWATAAGNDRADFTPAERRIARGAALADNALAAQIRAIPIEGETT